MRRSGYKVVRSILGLGVVGSSVLATTCAVNEPLQDIFGICLAGATDCGFVDDGGATSEPQCTLENPDCGDTVVGDQP